MNNKVIRTIYKSTLLTVQPNQSPIEATIYTLTTMKID